MAVRVRESFSFDYRGVPVTLREGELYEDGHPYTKGREQMFDTADEAAHSVSVHRTETASADPGESRGVTTVRKRVTKE